MVEINNTTRARINERLAKKIIERFLKYYKKENYEVSVAFVGDRVIKNLNFKYRKKNKPTDVLAFPGEGKFLGEIIIDYAQIKRQAPKFSKNIEEELMFILVHGLLHLLGFNDETDEGAREMESLGKKFLQRKYD